LTSFIFPAGINDPSMGHGPVLSFFSSISS
jgi:hypothetical protein